MINELKKLEELKKNTDIIELYAIDSQLKIYQKRFLSCEYMEILSWADKIINSMQNGIIFNKNNNEIYLLKG